MIYLYKEGAKAKIVDDYSTMRLAGSEKTLIGKCNYFSLLPVAGKVRGVDICGAKYSLHNAQILPEYIYSSSNEVLPGQQAAVSVKDGLLLVVEVDGTV